MKKNEEKTKGEKTENDGKKQNERKMRKRGKILN